jgi:hypothetical protein
LIIGLKVNLLHKKYPIRLSSLQALKGLIINDGYFNLLTENGTTSQLVDNLIIISLDKSSKVKESLIQVSYECLSVLTIELKDNIENTTISDSTIRNEIQVILLPFLLSGIYDSIPSIQQLSISLFNKLGIQYSLNQLSIHKEYNENLYLPPPFKGKE